MKDIFAELAWRGLVHQVTDPDLAQKLAGPSLTVYCGLDPSGESLQVGNLLGLLTLRRFQRAGHRPIALAGGGTGFIGDPSGKSEERALLSPEQLARNLECIRQEMARVLDFGPGGALLLNNADWLGRFSLIDFLREVGKHFTVNMMLEKESVRARLEDRQHGISYTEFSYMLLQAYDFLHLYRNYGCRLQIGGSDQFGNITAGCELIRRSEARRGTARSDAGESPVYGMTWALLTRSDGKKFGKTEEGAVYLSPAKTSPYEFYQYWINLPDADVGRFLRLFTELGREEIEDLEARSAAAPEKRESQRKLARILTELVHGPTERQKAEQASAVLFGQAGEGGLAKLGEQALLEAVKGAPSRPRPRQGLEGDGTALLELMVDSGLWSSRGEAKRALQARGVYLNDCRVTDQARKVTTADLLHGKYLVLRKGKKEHFLFRLE
jgi:tyrosyl-tRNA synthetase